jgi:hypothetical protein
VFHIWGKFKIYDFVGNEKLEEINVEMWKCGRKCVCSLG